MHELLAAHLQAEDADRELLVDGDVFGNVHGERCFPHARARRDHDHFRRMQATRHPIELDEAGGDAGDAAFALVELLDRFDRFHYLVFHRQHLPFETVFADGENLLFHFVEKIVALRPAPRRRAGRSSVQAEMIWRRMYLSRTISR